MTGKKSSVDNARLAVSRQRLQQQIKAAARRLQVQARLPPSVDLDDLAQAGMIGLLEAETRFDEEQGASFETFASRRIQGAMLDELRGRDWLPRSIRRQARVIERINGELEQRYGRAVRNRDVAEVMEVPLTEYHQNVSDISSGYLQGYDESEYARSAAPESDNWVEAKLLSSEREALLHRAIAAIEDEREREALILYHLKGLDLKTIGEHLEVSESRVCQLHRRAMKRVGSWLLQHCPEVVADLSTSNPVE